MTKLYVIIGECGLNEHWMEAVQAEPVTREQLARMDWDLRRSGAPTGFGGFFGYEVDAEPPYAFREIE